MKSLKLKEQEQQEIESLKEENRNLKQAMEGIRFIAFKHEVQYWNDATGTDVEKLGSIVILAREANWKTGATPKTDKIVKQHGGQ